MPQSVCKDISLSRFQTFSVGFADPHIAADPSCIVEPRSRNGVERSASTLDLLFSRLFGAGQQEYTRERFDAHDQPRLWHCLRDNRLRHLRASLSGWLFFFTS